MAKIRKHEQRINRDNKTQIETLNYLTQTKKDLASQLRSVIETVKRLDYQHKELQNQMAAKEHDYDEKLQDVSGKGKVTKLKQALMELKIELKTMYQNEGIINSTLFSNKVQRGGQHKLYDELSDPIKVSATGTKNNTEEA